MSNELARIDPLLDSVDNIGRIAKMAAESGYFGDAREIAKAGVKILAGRDLGIGPWEALSGIHVVQGKPQLSSTLIGALIKRSGRYNYRVLELDDAHCKLAFFENGEQIGESSWSIEDAKRAGLLKNSTWQTYPQAMLYARALSKGARMFCPDVFGGAVYSENEAQETGEVPAIPENTKEIVGEVITQFGAIEITEETSK